VRAGADGLEGSHLRVRPGESTVRIELEFESDPRLPPPSVGISVELPIGMPLSCFVARTDAFQELVKEIAMQVAAANPTYVAREDVPGEVLEKEREI
jgi:hypothetical protein